MIVFCPSDPLSRAALQRELDEKQAAEDAKKKPAAKKAAADKDKDRKDGKEQKAKDKEKEKETPAQTRPQAQPPSAPTTPDKPKKQNLKKEEKKADGKDSKTATPQPATRKVGAKKGDKDTDAQSLSLGPFSLSPAIGSVLPGGTVTIDVVFNAHTLGSFLELVDIDISERDAAAEPRILYELTAEGCTPGELPCQLLCF